MHFLSSHIETHHLLFVMLLRFIDMLYAPIHLSSSSLLQVANLTSAKNWDNVVDFRWHRSTASPNWAVAPKQQRVSHIEAEGWDIPALPVLPVLSAAGSGAGGGAAQNTASTEGVTRIDDEEDEEL